MTTDRLNAALLCAHHLLSVFPVWWTRNGICQCAAGRRCESPGKHPLPRGWQDVATIKPDVIGRMWGRWPDANIGLACGPSGILVLDIDPRHGGDDTLAELIAQHGPLPQTVETITGGGGRHIYFAAPAGITNHSPFSGIDIRGSGGYVLAAGSVHVSGATYEWEISSHPDDTPIAPAPPWLIAAARAGVRTDKTADPLPERIPEGKRHAALLSMAGSLRNRGATVDEIDGCLAIFNRRCMPSLPDEEVRAIADSMDGYAVGSAPFYAIPPLALATPRYVIRLEKTRVRL